MSRILIHIDRVFSGEYDIFNRTDHDKMLEMIPQIYGGNCPNFGNRLWFQGVISEIATDDNVIEYWDETRTPEEINSRYDMIIAPMANVFSVGFRSLLDKLAIRFSKITIPIYVIACGVQAGSYDDLENICNAIKEPATRFIRAVYNTGGEFALRGYFSKEFFDRLGFYSAVVTGCPSLYQLGRGSTITNDFSRVELCDFSPIVNGKLKNCLAYLEEYPRSKFFDQHTYYDFLYGKRLVSETLNFTRARQLVKEYGLKELEMLVNNRVCLLPNMSDWMYYIQQEGFQFSFGSRIHGNIMPILAGIPAVVYACDSRTQEMAEFFHIPMVTSTTTAPTKFNLYELYQSVDYSDYNRHFGENYDAFECFLQTHGIVKHINTNNRFFSAESKLEPSDSTDYDRTAAVYQFIQKHHALLAMYDSVLQISRKVRRI